MIIKTYDLLLAALPHMLLNLHLKSKKIVKQIAKVYLKTNLNKKQALCYENNIHNPLYE